MCEASAYLMKEGKETLILESVDIVESMEDGGYRLMNIFGEQIIIKARILKMKLVDHKILFMEDEMDVIFSPKPDGTGL